MTIDTFVVHIPAVSVALPLLSAFLFHISSSHKKVRSAIAIFSLVVLELLLILQLLHVAASGGMVYAFGSENPAITLPSGYAVPVRIIFQVDMLNALLSVITSSVVLLVVIFSLESIDNDRGRFYSLLMLMTAGMLGLSFTNDFFNMFVFLEVLSLSTGVMILYGGKMSSIEAGFKYILISSVGGIVFLLGVGFIYGQYGVLNISAFASLPAVGVVGAIALAFIVVTLLLKSGAVPMHMWLPDAYGEAPSYSVLAVAMATLISVYVLARISFVFALNNLSYLLILLGLLSAVVGSTMSLIQKNINRLFGYIALGEIGFIMTALGCGLALTDGILASNAVSGGLFHILNDILDLGVLFFIAGVAIHIRGSKELDKLSGFGDNRVMVIFFILAMFAISGLPPMNGFLSKLIIYESTFVLNPGIPVVLMVSSIIMLSSITKVFYSLFGGKSQRIKIPFNMLVALLIIISAMLIITALPDLVLDNLIKPAADALMRTSDYATAVMGVV